MPNVNFFLKATCNILSKHLNTVGVFNLKCLLIELVIPNLSQIYFRISETSKTNIQTLLLSTKSPFEIVFIIFVVNS